MHLLICLYMVSTVHYIHLALEECLCWRTRPHRGVAFERVTLFGFVKDLVMQKLSQIPWLTSDKLLFNCPWSLVFSLYFHSNGESWFSVYCHWSKANVSSNVTKRRCQGFVGVLLWFYWSSSNEWHVNALTTNTHPLSPSPPPPHYPPLATISLTRWNISIYVYAPLHLILHVPFFQLSYKNFFYKLCDYCCYYRTHNSIIFCVYVLFIMSTIFGQQRVWITRFLSTP